MAARSIASLSLSFGLVTIPIKLYSATESSAAIRFKLMGAGGSRVRQQYVTDAPVAAEEQEPEEEPEEAPEEKPGERKPGERHFEERQSGTRQPGEPPPEEPRTLPASHGEPARVVDFPTSRRELPVEALPYSAAYRSPEAAPAVVERSQMVKGYEFEKGSFVLFTADELKALEERSRQTIDIVAFVPEHAVDPIYFQKAYFLAPDKRGAKAYNLLLRAMRDTGRCALAKWAFRSKEYVVQLRPAQGVMVLQQLFYSDEVRSPAGLDIEQVDVGAAELELARQLIGQISVDTYDPTEFVDEEKKRILAAVEEKIAGKQIVAPEQTRPASGAEVVDLLAALRASLQPKPPSPATINPVSPAKRTKPSVGERKPLKRAATRSAQSASPAKGRASRK